jgi:pre-rRNA-processing protein TSR3
MSIVFEVLVDKTEKPNKCTILPQAERHDFRVRRFARDRGIPPLMGQWLLHPDGAEIEVRTPHSLNGALGEPSPVLSVVDCNWRRLAGILCKVEGPLPPMVKIPSGFVTAYPRKNSQNLDPQGGLATIEAIFIAAGLMGQWDPSLLDKFHWQREFFENNHHRLKDFGFKIAGQQI